MFPNCQDILEIDCAVVLHLPLAVGSFWFCFCHKSRTLTVHSTKHFSRDLTFHYLTTKDNSDYACNI